MSSPIISTPPPSYRSPPPTARVTSLPTPDEHQHLLDYYKTDLPYLTDLHSDSLCNATSVLLDFSVCQDLLIANDWENHHIDHKLPTNVAYPLLGPRSKRNWTECLHKVLNHHLHTAAMVTTVDHMLTPRMHSESLQQPSVLKCDAHLHVNTHLMPSYYQSPFPPVNPFFTTHKTFKLNTIMAVANFHGDITLVSTIFNALHIPFPDADIMHTLVE